MSRRIKQFDPELSNGKRSRRKNWIILAVVVVLIILLGVWLYLLLAPRPFYYPTKTGYITSPGVLTDEHSITVTRTTKLDFSGIAPDGSPVSQIGYYRSDGVFIDRDAQLTDIYVIQNQSSEDALAEIIYPVEGYDTELNAVEITVNGKELTDWYGMCSFVALDSEDCAETIIKRLEDGTNFAMAFPNWPERGTPCTALDDPELFSTEPTGSRFSYAFAYYLQPITIPAGGSTIVYATYPLIRTDKIVFPACYKATPCESHTLIIENADYVELEDENLGITDLSGTVRLDLDPTRTDYFMEFDVEMP